MENRKEDSGKNEFGKAQFSWIQMEFGSLNLFLAGLCPKKQKRGMGLKIDFKVQCVHTEKSIDKNVDMEFVELLEVDAGAVYRCPKCFRQIVVKLEILEEQ